MFRCSGNTTAQYISYLYTSSVIMIQSWPGGQVTRKGKNAFQLHFSPSKKLSISKVAIVTTTTNNNNNRYANSQQPQPSQHHHREAPGVYRLERSAYKSMATEDAIYNTTSSIHSGIIRDKLHDSLKLLHLRPALYSLMQKAAILNTSRIVRKFLVE